MTANAAPLPGAPVDEVREPILALPGVSGLALNLTTRPPGDAGTTAACMADARRPAASEQVIVTA